MDFIPLDLPFLRNQKAKKSTRTMGYSLNRFIDTVPDELLCFECHRVARDPVECQDCGCLFCKNCLPEYMIFFKSPSTDFTCKSCKKQSTFKEISKVKRRRIENLTVHCKFKGCNDAIKLCMLKSHLKSCQYQLIYCKKKDCTARELKMKSFRLEISPGWQQGEEFKQEMWTCSLRCKKILEFECSLLFGNKHTSISLYYSLLEKILEK